jgi:hypothetical protein
MKDIDNHHSHMKINLYIDKDDNLESAFQIFSFYVVLGQLSGWNLTADDIILLKGILKSSNSCLQLSPANFYS